MSYLLRHGWNPKGVRNGLIGVAALAAVVLAPFLVPDDGVRLGVSMEGVVVSSGPVNMSGACGGTREMAVVRLAGGRLVQASVIPSRPLPKGTPVLVSKQLDACDSTGYEVALRR